MVSYYVNHGIQETLVSSFIVTMHNWSHQNGGNYYKRINNTYVNPQRATSNNCNDDEDLFRNIIFKLLQEHKNY